MLHAENSILQRTTLKNWVGPGNEATYIHAWIFTYTCVHMKHGWTALMWATDKDNLEMVELLLVNKADTNIPAKVSRV